MTTYTTKLPATKRLVHRKIYYALVRLVPDANNCWSVVDAVAGLDEYFVSPDPDASWFFASYCIKSNRITYLSFRSITSSGLAVSAGDVLGKDCDELALGTFPNKYGGEEPVNGTALQAL